MINYFLNMCIIDFEFLKFLYNNNGDKIKICEIYNLQDFLHVSLLKLGDYRSKILVAKTCLIFYKHHLLNLI